LHKKTGPNKVKTIFEFKLNDSLLCIILTTYSFDNANYLLDNESQLLESNLNIYLNTLEI